MLQLFNTLSGQKEEFVPLHKNKAGIPEIGMYVCGPTVYDLGHLGHGRSAVAFDVIRKYFLYKGFQVKFVTNYTDIDDKMIQRAEVMKITVPELAARIIPEYQRDYAALGVMAGDVQPLATEYIEPMIDIIQKLEKKDCTYVLDDGVYFDVTTFSEYGKLSKQKLDQLREGARVAVKESKRNPQDFVLWKFSKPGEPKWPSPWGEGRPGWHIECSAMSATLLGETFDVHGGGADLTFPHHECEIAQSESANEKPFARYWLHNGFIRVDNEKMSKSLGNFFTLRDIFEKYPPQAVRLLFLQTHYRSPIDFSDSILQQAKNALMRLHDFAKRISELEIGSTEDMIPQDSIAKNELSFAVKEILATAQEKFERSLDDDFEASGALAAWFDALKDLNRLIDQGKVSARDREEILETMKRFDSVLGVLFPLEEAQASEEVVELIRAREEARQQKNWSRADEIRQELLAKGIQLEDTAKGTVWKRV